jgi:hypothetical protein
MGEALAEIVLRRVEMRVDMHDADRLPDPLHQGAQQGEGHAVLAPEGEQVVQPGRLFLDAGEACLDIAQRDLELAEVGQVERGRVHAGIGMAPIRQHPRGGSDGARPVPRPGAVGGADIHRHAGDAELRRPVMQAGAEEGVGGGEGDGRDHRAVKPAARDAVQDWPVSLPPPS